MKKAVSSEVFNVLENYWFEGRRGEKEKCCEKVNFSSLSGDDELLFYKSLSHTA